jgi:predicted DNA-binding transcriptional regulator YafY
VNAEAMKAAVASLSDLILTLQGEGDYAGVQQLMTEKGFVSDDLQKDLNRLLTAGIPVDVIFEQGVDVLGL